ncbi:MAG: zf-HC2 domain-containing protein [Pseudomonadota bacterium]
MAGPMECAELRERIAPLLDGELSPAEERAAHAHLARCEACAAMVERAAVVPMPAPAAPAPESPEFWAAMDRALDEEAHRPAPWVRRVRGWWSADVRVSRGAVALYLALLTAAFLWHLVGSPQGTAPIEPGVAAGEPAPAAPPAAAPAPRQPPPRLQKASYAPVQQMY